MELCFDDVGSPLKLVGLGQSRAGSTFKTVTGNLDTQVCPRSRLFQKILNSKERHTPDPGGL